MQTTFVTPRDPRHQNVRRARAGRLSQKVSKTQIKNQPLRVTYQTVHVPTVYMPSYPPSPTLHSQRTPLPKHSLDRDVPARGAYIPDDTLMPQPFSQLLYDPHLEVCLLPPSFSRSIAYPFVSEQRVCLIYPKRTCLLTGATRWHRSQSLRQNLCSHRTALFPPSRNSIHSPSMALPALFLKSTAAASINRSSCSTGSLTKKRDITSVRSGF